VVAGFIAALHCHSLKIRSKASRNHDGIYFLVRQIYSCLEPRQPLGGGMRLAGIQEPIEIALRVRPATHDAEFHEAACLTRFTAQPTVANSDPVQTYIAPQQYRVTQAVIVKRLNFSRKIKTRIHLVGEFAASHQARFLFCLRQPGIGR